MHFKFKRFNQILSEIKGFISYVDDFLIYAPSNEEHNNIFLGVIA